MTVRWYQLARDFSVQGVEILRATEAAGKGVILTTTHCGWIQCLTWRLASAGYPYTAVSGGWIAHSTKPYDVRQMPMVNAGIAAGTHHIIAGTGAFDQLNAVVEAGGRAGMAIDMPGSLELTYLGKPARLGQATFRISWANGAPILPMFIRRTRLRLWSEFLPPIWPHDYDSFEEFAQAATDVLSEQSLAYAELYLPQTVDALWPGGSAERARPNRATWAEKLGTSA
jgi:lauroyl/myristoyl acyltransferase